MRGKAVLNQSLIYRHPFPPRSLQFFTCRSSTQQTKKTILWLKNIGEGHMPPQPPQVTPMGDNTDIPP
jgi:hypothetical protein